MTEEAKKYLAIGLVIVCLAVAGFMVKRTFFQSSNNNVVAGDEKIALICKTCGGFEVSRDEFREMIRKQGTDTMMMMDMPGRPTAMVCPKCSNKSCYLAIKCPYCGTIFISGQARDQRFLDRCPKCGKSEVEERRKGG